MYNLISYVGNSQKGLEFKLMLYIILGLVVLVVVSLLLDGIRKAIRGLDIAALGALIAWCGYQASNMAMVSVLSGLLYLVGGTLFALGLIAFVFLKIYRHKRNVRQAETYSGPPMPKEPAREPAEEPAADPAEEK